jgi:amino acid permease
MDPDQSLALQALQRGAHVPFIAADGVHEVLMTGGHGASGLLVFGHEPGEDVALQAEQASGAMAINARLSRMWIVEVSSQAVPTFNIHPFTECPLDMVEKLLFFSIRGQ